MLKKFRRIYHPTDFSKGSQTAFEHALRLALSGQGSLRLVHVGERLHLPDFDIRLGERPRVVRIPEPLLAYSIESGQASDFDCLLGVGA